MGGQARLVARELGHLGQGLSFTVHEGSQSAVVQTALIGDYNVSNLLAVIGGLRAMGVSLAEAAQVCGELSPVPGRMQRVPAASAGLPQVVVDYAHTPDALDKALQALRPLTEARGGALWCVFGCGGNRDAQKRPVMGALAERLADHLVLTSDNPRDESPAAILAEVLAGVQAPAARPGDRRPRCGHRPGRAQCAAGRCGAGRRQGSRGLPGDRRHAPTLLGRRGGSLALAARRQDCALPAGGPSA